MIEMKEDETIVAVVPESARGPGWRNEIVWVFIREPANKFRVEVIQPADQTPEMRTLFKVAAQMHLALVSAVEHERK